jgi:hypothetical protein
MCIFFTYISGLGSFSVWRPGFNPGYFTLRFMDEVALELVFLQVPPLLITIPPLLHAHLSLIHEVCNRSYQAAHYRALGPKLGASSLTWHLTGLGIKVVCVCESMSFIVQYIYVSVIIIIMLWVG